MLPVELPPRHPWVPTKNVSPFGPVVWVAIKFFCSFKNDEIIFLCFTVAHKRSFCAELSSNVNHKFSGEDKENQTTTVVIQAEDTLCSSDPENWNMDNYSPSMDLIRTSGYYYL